MSTSLDEFFQLAADWPQDYKTAWVVCHQQFAMPLPNRNWTHEEIREDTAYILDLYEAYIKVEAHRNVAAERTLTGQISKAFSNFFGS